MDSLHGVEDGCGREGEVGYGCSDGAQYVGAASVACDQEEKVPGGKRLRLMAPNQQWIGLDVEKESTQPSALGLRLNKTSFMELIQARLSQGQPPKSDAKQNLQHEMVTDKVVNAVLNPPSAEEMKASNFAMKASNFAATFLKIGSWEWVSRGDGDLVAKCYFAKRKLIWEVLEGGLKSKIEIHWSDITSLRVTYHGNNPDQLEVELSKAPHFFRETNPQPRKHTLWQATSDFTGGQAVIYRRHLIQFAEGTLEKHYEKLLRCDSRLHMLSKASFPSSVSPYFETGNKEYQEHRGHLSQLLQQNNSTITFTSSTMSNEIFHPPTQSYVQDPMICSPFNQGDFQHVRSTLDFDSASSSVVDSPASQKLGINNFDDGYMAGSLQYCEPGNKVYQEHIGHLSQLLLQNNSTISFTSSTMSNEIFHPPAQVNVQAPMISSPFNQGGFQYVRSTFDFDSASSSSVVESSVGEELGISYSDDGYMGGNMQYCELVYSNIHGSYQDSYLNMSSNITLGNQVNDFSQGHAIPRYPSLAANGTGNISTNQEALEAIARHLLDEPSVSESYDNQNQQMIAGMNSGSYQDSYLNMSSNTTLGNQVNHFSEGHVVPYYPSFPTNGTENITANQEIMEGITGHLLYEPIVSESYDNQNQQMIAGMNSVCSLVGATGTSINTFQQGDLDPLYQIVTENADTERTLSSNRHIVPSSWGTANPLVEPMHGMELQNNVYGVPSY